jgi:hypothetical protein
VDVFNASQANVVMFNEQDSGAVSISFGAPQVLTNDSETKLVRVENKGGTDASYSISFSNRTVVPGVSFSIVDDQNAALTSLTIKAHSTAEFKVKLDIDATKFLHTHDVTVAETQAGLPRQWLSEASGLVEFSNTNGEALRLPVYAAPQAASAMKSATISMVANGATGIVNLPLTGTGLDTTALAASPVGESALVSAFQLMATSPNEDMGTGNPIVEKALDAADLHYVGAARDANCIYFAIATYAPWTTPNSVEFDIDIDVNHDGTPEYTLFNYNLGSFSGNDPSDVYLTSLINYSTNKMGLEEYVNFINPSNVDTAPMNTNVMIMPVDLTDLGLSSSSDSIDFWVTSYAPFDYTNAVDTTGPMTFYIQHPAIDTGYAGFPLYYDKPNTTLPIGFDKTNWAPGTQDVLLLHHHNASDRAEVVTLWPNGVYLPNVAN